MPETVNRVFYLLKNKPEIFLAVAATIVSVCALGATLYQTILMRQQQFAAVWPRLEMFHSWNRETSTPYYRLHLRNVGIGPAIIRKVSIQYRNKSYESFGQLARFIAGENNLNQERAYQAYSDLMPDMVIPQQEKVELLVLLEDANVLYFTNALKEVQVTVEYESLYGQAWQITYPKISHREVE